MSDSNSKKSVNLLPSIFRTDKNSKFLSATLDQLIQTPQLSRVNAWAGTTNTKTYNPLTDYYIPESLPLRKNYQLEPAVVVKDSFDNIKKSFGYDDLINQISFEGGKTDNLANLFKPEYYSYDPHIDWDKFINFDQYYWLPVGPDSVTVEGLQKSTVSTYTITDAQNGENFIITPDGLTPDVTLTLYKGITYNFDVNSKHKVWIKVRRIAGASQAFQTTITNNGTSNGTITLTVDDNTPATLYYVAEDDELVGGQIIVKSIIENSVIDITKEILGKKTYTSGNGIVFTNGLKVNFAGSVTPESYQGTDFIVEGVGTAIRLISVDSLQTPESYASTYNENYDGTNFDDYPFDNYNSLPLLPEYITINRSSRDLNPWSRYNRWFHKDVIAQSALYNGTSPSYDQTARATRPIVEFKPDIQLYNFGSQAKPNIQHIDTTTVDAFNAVEGQIGYYVDGVLLGQGDRIIFLADKDPLVYGITFIVNFVKLNGNFVISLDPADDSIPNAGDNVSVLTGNTHQGSIWWFDGTVWTEAQEKTSLNQFPKFDVFDEQGVSYSNYTSYTNNTFNGTYLFNYAVGNGANDSVLGFPLLYKTIADQGYYLFNNYFMTDIILITEANGTTTVPIKQGFLKVNNINGSKYENVWTEGKTYAIPIIQSRVITTATSSVEIIAVDNPGYQNISVGVFLNDVRLFESTDYNLFADKNRYFVTFVNQLSTNDRLLFKLYTNALPNNNGYYEVAVNYSNNPFNGPISQFTLAELSDHAETMANAHPNFTGTFFGNNNIRDIGDFNQYGTRLISNKTPAAFAGYFISDKENSVISALRKSAIQYSQFKLSFLKRIKEVSGSYDPMTALDIVLHNMNVNKDINFPYINSDMLAYGKDYTSNSWTVTDSRNTKYSLNNVFSTSTLSLRSVLVYYTSIDTGAILQLINGVDYTFDTIDPAVDIIRPLSKGDIISIRDYTSTTGCFVPFTPTKLGLYPASVPSIYLDDTYSTPTWVIEGHDGSIMVAYGDYRDDIILEFECRIYNNIKTFYNTELLDINEIMPGAFRPNDYSYGQISDILKPEFLNWAGFYGLDYENNTTATDDPKTFNYSTAKDNLNLLPLPGGWRGIFKFFYDTDRPHTCPWEMLGFPTMPMWWTQVYGPAPYTAGNLLLWQDLETGTIRDPSGISVNSLYARPGLTSVIPVDNSGMLLDPVSSGIASGLDPNQVNVSWNFGDIGPVETAWRRSSLWPFAVQIMMALARPAKYCSLMFDTSRMSINSAGQIIYNKTFIDLTNLEIYSDISSGTLVQSAGYSPILVEINRQRSSSYVQELKTDLSNTSLNLMYKVGGFVNKDKIDIIIDSVNPATKNPGVALPNEDYNVFLNQSNPVESIGVSGIIVERTDSGFVLRGYDKLHPYFNCYYPVSGSTDPAFVVGGKSEPYVIWTASSTPVDVAIGPTAVNPTHTNFYQAGQVVSYNNLWYRVKVSHESGTTFNPLYFTQIPSLPRIGGVSVLKAVRYSDTVTQIPYGTEYTNLQDLYYAVMGYGQWLLQQGLVLDQYNSDFEEVIDWNFTAKELLFWTTQNWTSGSIITLSPFSSSLKFNNSTAVVDSLINPFTEYSVLKADGNPLPLEYVNTNRTSGQFSISTLNTNEGIYFVRLNFVQQEHVIVLNNKSIFGDIIYDVESGYRQARIKLIGFITGGWDGGLTSPGFIYDEAIVNDWVEYTDYGIGDVVRYVGNYYTANKRIDGASTFDFTSWQILSSKPTPQLLPNFDYKINQFRDFYNLNIDNFDAGQQKMAQHLTAYQPRTYMSNIFIDPISQYKFYQGFIREKGTQNVFDKLSKASEAVLHGEINYNEEWAFRIGEYGSLNTKEDIEISLDELQFKENPQIIEFVDVAGVTSNSQIIYKTPSDVIVKPNNYTSEPFSTTQASNLDFTTMLPMAGYPRIDDVTSTAFNKYSLLDIANNRNLNDGDTIWLGIRDDGDWDVLRYSKIPTNIVGAKINFPGSSILLTTNLPHKLNVGDLISISQLDSNIDGVYQITEIPELNQFIVASTLTLISPTLTPGIGLLFKFASVRLSSFDDLNNFEFLNDLKEGEKIWVDNDGNNRWGVFEKVNAYDTSSISSPAYQSPIRQNEQYGYRIAGSRDGKKWAIASPTYYNYFSGYGIIYVYRKDGYGNTLVNITQATLNDIDGTSYTSTTPTGLGQKLIVDGENNFIIAGAPYAHNKNVSLQTTPESGYVKFLGINFTTTYITSNLTLANPSPSNYAHFGYDIAQTDNTIVISSPGADTVHVYSYNIASGSITLGTPTTITSPVSGIQFGYSIAASKDGSIIAVAAPGVGSQSTGTVYVYNNGTRSAITTQGLSAYDRILPGDGFANKLQMTDDGTYLFITAPNSSEGSDKKGKVIVMELNTSTNLYEFNQVITSPYSNLGVAFGTDIGVTPSGDVLTVSSIGSLKQATFDKYSTVLSGSKYTNDPASQLTANPTTFDSKSTTFTGSDKSSGSAFVFNRYSDMFVFGQEIFDTTVGTTDLFGESIFATDSVIMVGAPGLQSTKSQTGSVYIFDKNVNYTNSWNLLREEVDLVDLSAVQKIYTIDDYNSQVQDYLDVVDPVKGRIPGIANQELKYKMINDPAIYSIGNAGTNNNTSANWIDDHVGELWWDLSTVKFVWYEQGELEFRRNNWGGIFPGCTIDVYEWVRSTYLPSQWSALADTTDGLIAGISGQPKYPDNSVISVKQIFSSTTQGFTNVYYYWVKNKVVIPNNTTRRMSAFDVANTIANPRSVGLKYISFLANNAVMLANSKPSLNENNIHLAIEMDTINNNIPIHTEWLLLQENNINSLPSDALVQKILDSALGHDSQGNPVPDPTLPNRLKYGVQIRPRQSVFVDRLGAIRTLVEYSNSVLEKNLIVDNYDISPLDSKEPIPNIDMGTYDVLVEDLVERDALSPRYTKQAVLTCRIQYGKIIDISIIDPGFGYKVAPTVTVTGSGINGEIRTTINTAGSVIGVSIIDPGKNYTFAPTLTVRPFTVIVNVDSSVNNKWSKYEWNYSNLTWGIPVHVQSYDTTNYWSYIDWVSPTFNPNQEFLLTIDAPYELAVLTNVPAGNYIKINNNGNGRSIVLKKLSTTAQPGTYNREYDLVYEQNGTIKLLDSLWNFTSSTRGFDGTDTAWDQTEFDSTPDVESQIIFNTLNNNVFVRDLQIHLNKLFFKLVRYALTEQKFLDWAFKTSFIGVTNNAGELNQPATYKLDDTSYYESFIEEAKPYRTKVRTFTDAYTSTEVSLSMTTDFDLPSYYDTALKQFTPVTFGSPLLNQQPYKSWFENYTYYVKSIDVFDGGSGYQYPPQVVVQATNGDVVTTTATAVAYIALGKVSQIVVTNPGAGYTSNPKIILEGGGPTTLTSAKVGAKLANDQIRSTLTKIKFDRVAGYNEITTPTAVDEFTGDGYTHIFPLTWYPEPNKRDFEVTVGGLLKLDSDYTINYSTGKFNGYTKQYATITLNTTPTFGSPVVVTYTKNVSLYRAVDRIQNYYSPTSGMPGNTATLLMSGLEYPGVTIDTLPFHSSLGWDTAPWGGSTWDDYVSEPGVYQATSPVIVAKFDHINTDNGLHSFNVANNLSIRNVQVGAIATLTNTTTVFTVTTSTSDTQYRGYWEIGFNLLTPTLTTNTNITFTNPNPEVYTLPYTPVVGTTITVYVSTGSIVNAVRIDDPNYGTDNTITNPNATMQSFTGTVGVNTISIGQIVGPNDIVIFRPWVSDGTTIPTDVDLDTLIYGGTINGTTISESDEYTDINLDGDGFISPWNSYGPEENLPGNILESVGISVFTRPQAFNPLIINKKYFTAGTQSTFALGTTPPNNDSVMVLWNDNPLYVNQDFTIDFSNNTLTTFNTLGSGLLSITTIGVSSGDILEYDVFNISNTTTNILTFASAFNDVESSYVTVNGVTTSSYQILSTTNGYDINRSSLKFNSNFNQEDVVQVWLFNSPYKAFSQVYDQVITTGTTGVSVFDLVQPPGKLGPFHSQVIVEYNGVKLLPPDTLYFVIENNQLTYPLNAHYNYQTGAIDASSLEVYINGLLANLGDQYELMQTDNTVRFNSVSVKNGDAIAIVNLIGHQYEIQNNQLVLTSAVDTSSSSNTIRIVTFTDGDTMGIRKERFAGNISGRYLLSRTVLNSNYLWVEVNGSNLTNNYDYKIDADGQTLILSDSFILKPTDNVVVMSISDITSQSILGYRMFKDSLGRTSYKRLSLQNTTQLAQPLTSTDTTITVVDASVLGHPNISRNQPGILLIFGERIEYYVKTGNVLSQIKRGTFATGVRSLYPAGTAVIDQSPQQNIPVLDYTQTERIITSVSTATFDLNNINFTTALNTASGNLIHGISTSSSALLDSQIQVFYQGKQLTRPEDPLTLHDPNIAYDSGEYNSDIIQPAGYYIDTNTHQLILSTATSIGSQIEVVRNVTALWIDHTVPMHDNSTEQVKFLLERPAALPDKYYYGQQ
jgi:hypothetical protein